MFYSVDVLGQKVDLFVVDVLEVDVLELVYLGWPGTDILPKMAFEQNVENRVTQFCQKYFSKIMFWYKLSNFNFWVIITA